MTNKHTKRCLASSVIWKTQIKATINHYFTAFTVATVQKPGDSKCWWEEERLEPFWIVGVCVCVRVCVKWCSCYGNSVVQRLPKI
jgi:hypothetical protein